MDVYANSKHLTKLIASEETPGAAERMLGTFSVGLYSKHTEVAEWVLRLTSKILYDLYDLGLLETAYKWALSENGVLDGIIFIMLRHNLLDEAIGDLLIQLGRGNNIVEVFIQLREYIPNSEGTKPSYDKIYAEIVLRLLKPISNHRMVKELLDDTDLLSRWIDVFSRMAETARGNSEKGIALNVLTELWILFPNKIEIEVQKYIINILKRSTREKNIPLQLVSLSLLFHIFHKFALEKNPIAPAIYKSLTFSLMESHNNIQLRKHIMANFISLFEKVHNIPVGILMDPLIKQVYIYIYIYNRCKCQRMCHISSRYLTLNS